MKVGKIKVGKVHQWVAAAVQKKIIAIVIDKNKYVNSEHNPMMSSSYHIFFCSPLKSQGQETKESGWEIQSHVQTGVG